MSEYKYNGSINFIKKQIEGLTGHIEEAGFPFDTVEWGKEDYTTSNNNPGWWVYEQTAYWLDGFTRCAIILKDNALLDRAKRIIYNVVLNPDQDGYLGPKFLKNAGDWNRWPHVVFFRACIALFEHNNDKRILTALSNHYLNDKADYSYGRNVNNVEIMLWLYGKTNNRTILELAINSYNEYNKKCRDDLCDKVALSNKKPYAHGVSYNEYSKLGSILYKYTKNKKYLNASVKAYHKIDKYFMLIDGCHCSDEFMISNDVCESHETCCISDYTWSLNYLFEATNNTMYLDKIEKCIFNAGLGAITKDFKSLQYFSCVNQVISDQQSNHNVFYKGNRWMNYSPNPGTECCPGNVNRFMPNYILNSWKGNNNDIYLKLYCTNTIEYNDIKIEEETNYPFNNCIKLKIDTLKPFKLYFRVPKDSDSFSISFDGINKDAIQKDGFASIQINKSCNLLITFNFGCKKHIENNYVWFSKGPVVYTNAIEYKKEIIDINKKSVFPTYNFYSNEKWNYGVYEDVDFYENADGSIDVEGYEITNWKYIKIKRVKRCVNLYTKEYKYIDGNFTFTPNIPKNMLVGDKKMLHLVPYGLSELRITALPKLHRE